MDEENENLDMILETVLEGLNKALVEVQVQANEQLETNIA